MNFEKHVKTIMIVRLMLESIEKNNKPVEISRERSPEECEEVVKTANQFGIPLFYEPTTHTFDLIGRQDARVDGREYVSEYAYIEENTGTLVVDSDVISSVTLKSFSQENSGDNDPFCQEVDCPCDACNGRTTGNDAEESDLIDSLKSVFGNNNIRLIRLDTGKGESLSEVLKQAITNVADAEAAPRTQPPVKEEINEEVPTIDNFTMVRAVFDFVLVRYLGKSPEEAAEYSFTDPEAVQACANVINFNMLSLTTIGDTIFGYIQEKEPEFIGMFRRRKGLEECQQSAE